MNQTITSQNNSAPFFSAQLHHSVGKKPIAAINSDALLPQQFITQLEFERFFRAAISLLKFPGNKQIAPSGGTRLPWRGVRNTEIYLSREASVFAPLILE